METPETWSVLFLPAQSPGQIIRYVQRQKSLLTRDDAPAALLLSDGVGAFYYRALTSTDASARLWLEALGLQASNDFHPAARFLWKESAPKPRCGVVAWDEGHEIKRENFDAIPPPPTGMFARFNRKPALTGELVWARKWLLPTERIPHLARKSLPVVDYETVAALDRKSLLVENSPRLYRFALR